VAARSRSPEITTIGVSLSLPDALADGDAVHAGHRKVEQDQVRSICPEAAQRLLAVVCSDDPVSRLAKQRPERADHRGLVVDDEDP